LVIRGAFGFCDNQLNNKKMKKEINEIKEIISPIIRNALKMQKAKKDWIDKIRNLREEVTESGKITIVFEEILPEETKGWFYQDVSLADTDRVSDSDRVYYNGTPVNINKITCFIHTQVNYSQDGEFFPETTVCLLFEFYSTSKESSYLYHFPGDLKWVTGLFSTYLNWPKENGDGIGFASVTSSSPFFYGSGWTMIFDDDNVRKLIIKKIKFIEFSLSSLLPKDCPNRKLLYK